MKPYVDENGFLDATDDTAFVNAAEEPDMVNHPPHYASMDGSGIECIDAIRASMTHEMFLGYLKGNAEKYLWRAGQKFDATEDLEKCGWYKERYEEELRYS